MSQDTCNWEEMDEGTAEYETQCGNAFTVMDNYSIEEVRFKFCPYCGGKINNVGVYGND